MAQYKLLLPKMGESVAEATVIRWEKNPGDNIEIDDIVLEVATDKVDSEVPSPVKGKLVQQFFAENEIAQVGDVIAMIETESQMDDVVQEEKIEVEHITEELSSIQEEIPAPEEPEEEIPFVPATEEKEDSSFQYTESGRFYSPLVKSIAQEEGLDLAELDKIQGTGAENRVTKNDLLNYIAEKNQTQRSYQKESNQAHKVDSSKEGFSYHDEMPSQPKSTQTVTYGNGNDEIIEMDRMRKLIADHMISSKQTSAHVCSFVEADVTNLVQWRNKVKDAFEKREGEKITFTPIFVEAVAKAIKDMPMINISVNGSQIIKKKDINIGMATALPSGNLIVPVIKNADQLNMVGLTKAVNDLAARARINKLQPDEIQGGTFTITNIGGFGNIMGTPIINQPQVAILAVGVIKKKPAVIETQHGDMIGIRHMMYLSLSYDHRVVDGALGGMFVRKVADYLEQWDSNREI
ncbi:dihydrolipoamide acetyltransferase family protein [Pedobacter glucosidilyticus]|uniref:dihydrolipoamide acetyltransferase family protein n=1 Tax=Pedobacter glucosidilyticus TaxID=1122941 RepID=UPI0004146E92|nr:dihydrolipoamide acetyltransferase family protein [Pedobacter glucosidilyticus]